MLKMPQGAWWRHCSETVFPWHRRSKIIAFLESVNFFTCFYVQIFNFRNVYVTTFWHLSGAYICQMPGHRLSRLAKGTPSESRLSICTIVWVKLFPVGYVQDSWRVCKKCKFFFWIWLCTRYKILVFFHDSIRSHLHFDGLPLKSWRSIVSV